MLLTQKQISFQKAIAKEATVPSTRRLFHGRGKMIEQLHFGVLALLPHEDEAPLAVSLRACLAGVLALNFVSLCKPKVAVCTQKSSGYSVTLQNRCNILKVISASQ